jgi:predicted amidohydrolase YtcJ
MKPLIRISVAMLVGLLCGNAVVAQESATPITVFVAKKIHTMDPGWPEATAVAVRDGKILSVGSLEDLEPWLKTGPYEIDRRFEGKILMPGFIEAHGHLILGSAMITRPLVSYLPMPSPYGPGFPGVKSWPKVAEKMKEYVAQAKSPDETVYAWGYDIVALGGKRPTKKELDAISTIQPLVIQDSSEHDAFANSAALAKYKVTKEDLKTNGIMAGPDGEPNGQFIGVRATTRILLGPMSELFKPDPGLKNAKFLVDLSRQAGITTTSELNMGSIDLDVEASLMDKVVNTPDSPMRIVIVTNADAAVAKYGEEAISYVQRMQDQSTDKMIYRGVKWFADDAFLSLGMMMENPGYTDGRKGLWNTPPDKMVEQMLPWWKAGFQINVHTNGNAGNESTLNALENLMRSYPRTGHRFAFQHFGMASPEQIRRIAHQGGVISINPYYVYARSEFNAPFVGSDRAYLAGRLKTIVDAGIPVSLHTDTPVAPPRPLEEVWIAVNRFGLSGQVRAPAERVSVSQALRMVTIDAALTLGVEDKIGSIEAGKFADFTVLEQDPYEVPKGELRDVPVWGTVVDGAVFPRSEIRP